MSGAYPVVELTIRWLDSGRWAVYLQRDGGQKHRIVTGQNHADHDIIRHGELVGEDYTPRERPSPPTEVEEQEPDPQTTISEVSP